MTDTIVDAHHDIWRLSETPWLRSPRVPIIFGAYEGIQRVNSAPFCMTPRRAFSGSSSHDRMLITMQCEATRA